ncbi:MAG: hypothetical protein ACUVXA_19895 [Candidatus Jordarchaeum sp.]|uniref:hypothetical protein n=1 Tax=Candidatus Jordarchaeum sp. TaxID=2823881 RepID=UPI00404A20C6
MARYNLSDFKMLEKAPYELPEPKLLTEFVIEGYKAVEKTYGPVYTTNFIKYALRFVKMKVGEEPVEEIKTLDQLRDYLASLSDKYSFPYCAAVYAQFNVENLLEGRIGAASMEMGHSKIKDVEKVENIEDRDIDIQGILEKYREDMISTRMAHHEMGYKANGDGSLDIIYPTCYLKEACKLAFDEGLAKRRDGTIQCGIMQYNCQYFKLVTSYNWDFKLVEYFEPHCIAHCFMF